MPDRPLDWNAVVIGKGAAVPPKAIPRGAANTVLTQTVVNDEPAFAKVDLASMVTGVLPVANGGTGSSTTMTQGSVVFVGASGVYAQDNTNFFWDDTNNQLSVGGVRLDATGRITQTVTPVYDLQSNLTAAAQYLPLGAVTVPNGNRLDGVLITGSLTSSNNTTLHELYGLVFDLTNDATSNDLTNDFNRVRGIIGSVQTSGPGSVRGVHVSATGTGTSTGSLSGHVATISAVSTTAISAAFVAANIGAANITDVLSVAGGSVRWRYGLDFHSGDFLGAAILLQNSSFFAGGAKAGRILWHTDGAFLEGLGSNVVQLGVADFKLGASGAGHYMELWEMTAPAAPATNSVRLFAEDNGAGKTRLVARFPTGTAVVIATEP